MRHKTAYRQVYFLLLVFMLLHAALSYAFAAISGEYIKTALALVISAGVVLGIFCFKKDKSRLCAIFRFKKISMSDAFIWFFLGICANCAFTLINIPINTFWTKILGSIPTIPPPATAARYAEGILCIGIVPAVAEELLCRGMVLGSIEKYGKKHAALFSAAAFSVLHNSLPSLVYTFLIGLTLAFIVFKTDSVISAMIFHFAINFFSLTVGFLNEKIPPHIGAEFAPMMSFVFIFLAIVFVICFAAGFLNRKKDNLSQSAKPDAGYWLWAAAIVCLYLIFQLRLF